MKLKLIIAIFFSINLLNRTHSSNNFVNYSWFSDSSKDSNINIEIQDKNISVIDTEYFYSIKKNFKAWFHDYNPSVILLLNGSKNDSHGKDILEDQESKFDLLTNNTKKTSSTLFEDWKIGWKFILNSLIM